MKRWMPALLAAVLGMAAACAWARASERPAAPPVRTFKPLPTLAPPLFDHPLDLA